MKKEYKEIQIELSDEEFIFLAKEAHKQNITFNKLVGNILKDFIKKTKHMSSDDIINLLKIKKDKNKNVSLRTKK